MGEQRGQLVEQAMAHPSCLLARCGHRYDHVAEELGLLVRHANRLATVHGEGEHVSRLVDGSIVTIELTDASIVHQGDAQLDT